MLDSTRRSRAARRVAVVFALGVLLVVLPAPKFTFLQASVGGFAPFPLAEEVGAAELADMQGAIDTTLVGDRVVGEVPLTERFTMIGVSLEQAPTEPVLVRVREADGAWSEWVELEYSADQGPDPGTGESSSTSTEPLWVGDAVGYELSVAEGDEVGAEVALVREQLTRAVTDAVPLAEAAAANDAPFPIQPRSAWNVRTTTTSSAASLRMAVVHHTASSNSYSPSDVPGIIRSMQAYHMDNNGWSDLAYNFIVDKFGTVWEGRGGGMTNAVIGAHAMGFNTGSVGVSVIGNYVETTPSPAALEGVARVVGWRLEAYGVDPRATGTFTSGGSTSIPAGQVVTLPVVVGHRDVGATSCPGSIYGSMTWIRNRGRAWFDVAAARHDPAGSVDGITAGTGVITTAGWAYDPDTSAPIDVVLIANGTWYGVVANRSRPDWASRYPAEGDEHGFAIGIEVPPGTYNTCVVARNAAEGRDVFLRCAEVVVK